MDRNRLDDTSAGRKPAERTGTKPAFFTDEERAQVAARLAYLAQRRYQFTPQVAEELVRSALETYLEAQPYYADWVDHPTHLIGTLRGVCREHIRRQICKTAQRNAIEDSVPGAQIPAAMRAGALDDIASHDLRELILEALSELRPKALYALRSLRDGATRVDLLDVIERLGSNKQSDAGDLQAYRTQFRNLLARCGIRL